MRSGQTNYNVGTGFWIGDVGGTPKFSMGNSSTNQTFTWDGSVLSTGSLTATSIIKVGSNSNVVIDGNNETVKVFSDSITITSGVNDDLDWLEDATTLAAVLTATSYAPSALAAHVQTQMRAQGAAQTTVTYNAGTRKITIANTSPSTFTLKWSTGASTVNTCGRALGFDVSADDSGAASYISNYQAALRVEVGLLQ